MKTRIDETNKMRKLMGLPLIKEQLDQRPPTSPANPGGVYSKPVQTINSPTFDPTEPQYGLWLDYNEDDDGVQLSGKLNVSWDTLGDIGKAAIGVLSLLAFGLIKSEVQRIFRKRDIKFIIREIGTLMEQDFNKDTIKCFKKEFIKVGKVENLNDIGRDEKTIKKVRGAIGKCLANSDAKMTVDQFLKQLNPIILKWDAKARKDKKRLRSRNKNRNQKNK